MVSDDEYVVTGVVMSLCGDYDEYVMSVVTCGCSDEYVVSVGVVMSMW